MGVYRPRQNNVITTWVAPKMYALLVQLQAQYGLSIQEVTTVILRKGMQEFLGFQCQHDKTRRAQNTGLPYCLECWTRMEETSDTMFDKGRVRKIIEMKPLPTFLEQKEDTTISSPEITSTSTEEEKKRY